MSGVKIYVELFLTFFKIGAVTFGGGLSMLPILERELCKKKAWVSRDDLIDYYAIGQVTPGIVAVNVATFCGHKLKGTFGGVVATLAIITPSIIVIAVLSSSINAIDQIPAIKKALAGINVAVAANLSFSVISFFKKSVASFFGGILFALAFALVFFFKASAPLVIFASGILGASLFFVRKKIAAKGKVQDSAASPSDSSLGGGCHPQARDGAEEQK